MPNYNYNKGVRKERKLVNVAKSAGLLAFRSAGSHSPIDVVIIDKRERVIKFIQCKPDNISERNKDILIQEQSDLNGSFLARFMVI